MASSLMAKYKAAKEGEKEKGITKDTPSDTSKRIDKNISTNTSKNTFNFMGLWKALGRKKQHNLPLTKEIARVVEEEGGSEYIIKILLFDLEKKGKLPDPYRVFLEF